MDSQSFRFNVKVFSCYALAVRPEKIFSPGPEHDLGSLDVLDKINVHFMPLYIPYFEYLSRCSIFSEFT
jgi:hypothetical protein